MEREAGGDGDRVDELGLVEERAVVDDHRDRLAVLAHDPRRDPVDVRFGHLERLTVGIDVTPSLLDPNSEADVRVVERTPQPLLCLLEARCLTHLEQKVGDAAACETALEQPGQEPEGHRGESDQRHRDQRVLDARVDRPGCKACDQQAQRDCACDADRPECPSRDRSGSAVPDNHQRDDHRDQHCRGAVRDAVDRLLDGVVVRDEEDVCRTPRARRMGVEHEREDVRHQGEAVPNRDDDPLDAPAQATERIGEDQVGERGEHERFGGAPDRVDDRVVR